MCSPTAFIRGKKGLKPVMEEISSIIWRDRRRFTLTDIMGRTLEFEGKILSMDLITHEIILIRD